MKTETLLESARAFRNQFGFSAKEVGYRWAFSQEYELTDEIVKLMAAFAAEREALEREACAKIAEDEAAKYTELPRQVLRNIAAAIRSRKEGVGR